MQRYLNLSGLALNMAGVILLFFFGFPQPDFQKGISLGVGEGSSFYRDGKLVTVKQVEQEQEAKEALYTRLSTLGLGLVLLGFVLQFATAVCDFKTPPPQAAFPQPPSQDAKPKISSWWWLAVGLLALACIASVRKAEAE